MKYFYQADQIFKTKPVTKDSLDQIESLAAQAKGQERRFIQMLMQTAVTEFVDQKDADDSVSVTGSLG